MKKVLIVIDMQHDFVDGSLGTRAAKGIVENVRNKIQQYYQNGEKVIFTRDTHLENYLDTNEGRHLKKEHCIIGTLGHKIIEGLEVPGCEYINKSTFGWLRWRRYDFEDAEIELVGLCTDICVVSNALILKAAFPEANITVDASCCAGVTPESHKAALLTMKMCQINIIGE